MSDDPAENSDRAQEADEAQHDGLYPGDCGELSLDARGVLVQLRHSEDTP